MLINTGAGVLVGGAVSMGLLRAALAVFPVTVLDFLKLSLLWQRGSAALQFVNEHFGLGGKGCPGECSYGTDRCCPMGAALVHGRLFASMVLIANSNRLGYISFFLSFFFPQGPKFPCIKGNKIRGLNSLLFPTISYILT